MVPLLRNAPEAQNGSDLTSKTVAVFVFISHTAPHAGTPSAVVNGLAVPARSKKMALVGEMKIASSARIPEVPFWTNSHLEGAASVVVSKPRKMQLTT